MTPNMLLETGGNASLTETTSLMSYGGPLSQTEEIKGPPGRFGTSLLESSTDSASSDCSSPCRSVSLTQTPAEKLREKRLRDDPMANVLGPLFIDCRGCGRRIKLSPKSTYDPAHWKTHKERCLKRSIGGSKKPQKFKRAAAPVASESPLSTPPRADVDSPTPPLTPDREDLIMEPVNEEYSTLNSRLLYNYSGVSLPAVVFDDYLSRSQRHDIQSVSLPCPQGQWQDWSWSLLKPPSFAVEPLIKSEELLPDESPSEGPPNGPYAFSVFPAYS